MPAVKVRDEGRLQRLVTLSYFLSTRSEIHMDELVERVGVDRKTIEKDLNVLMYIGLPPYSPGELFDIFIEDDFVSMLYNDVFLSPLKLNEQEKSQAIIALKKLSVQSDGPEKEAIDEIMNLIDSSQAQHLEITSDDVAIIDTIRKALEQSCAIELEYLSLHSASLSVRTVEPIRIFTTASVSYLYGYCHNAKARRVFRSDRIVSVSLLKDVPIDTTRSSWNDDFEESSQLFTQSSNDYVDLFIDRQAEWILDTFPHEIVKDKTSTYRFFGSSPYLAARLIALNPTTIAYVGGTIESKAIVEALTTIRNRMSELSRGAE